MGQKRRAAHHERVESIGNHMADRIVTEASGSFFVKASDAVLPIISLPIPTNVRGGGPSSITNSEDPTKDIKIKPVDSTREVIDTATELMMEATAEVVSVIFSVLVIVEAGNDLPDGMAETMEMVDPPCLVKGVEDVKSQGSEVPVSDAHSTEIRMEMVPSVDFSASAADSFKTAAKFLRSCLTPIDRWALDEEGAQHQMASAFRSLILISHYLVSFTGASFEFLPLELMEVKGELKKSKYYLEQEKTVNIDLIKEIDCSEKALFKAQEASGSFFVKASDAVLPIISLPIPTNVRGGGPSSITNSEDPTKDIKIKPVDSTREVIDTATELMMEATAEVVSVIFSVLVIVEAGNDLPDGMAETMEMVDPPCLVKGVEDVKSQGSEVPVSDAHSTEIRMEMVPSADFSSSTADSFKTAAKFLRSCLTPIDRWALDEEGAQHQMASAFRSLILISHYLVSFTGASFEFLPLELMEVKGELKKSKYYLEQEKTVNIDLIKEIDCSEKALFKAQEVIDR
ncbi:hypothetical protein COCNU_02G000600 [Cocos nucifera]|uniref:Uncharacterized protein n=1 Tax=Cocos nucifera TaxID=13894 RepID=A0A8K0HY27_COCNU|nr:hypothetical protein COCNU_02G000600 [Cocos nucifera]